LKQPAKPTVRRVAARVLIVDDNVDLAENIAEILAGEGHATAVAASAEQALTMSIADIAVLITDFRLPGISGAELVRRFRRQRGDLPAVVISAYSDDVTVGDARDAGAAFMAKPVDFLALNDFVRAAA
jgi:CheY-like chemotaxis protein